MEVVAGAVNLTIIIAASYLAGSFPTSIIVGRLFFHRDIREMGSGNAGGTNAFRAFGWKAGVPVILFDVGKGVIATLLLSKISVFAVFAPAAGGNLLLSADALMLIAGASAVAGHIWTVFARFHGGKGVGTAAGMMVSLYPLALGIVAAEFALVLISTGIVSLGSIIAAISFPLVIVLLSVTGVQPVSPLLLGFSIAAALLILFTHRTNIKRLMSRKENRFNRLALIPKLFRIIVGRRRSSGR